jgi:hypothetical protein
MRQIIEFLQEWTELGDILDIILDQGTTFMGKIGERNEGSSLSYQPTQA